VHANSYLPKYNFKKSKGWRKGGKFLASAQLFPSLPHPDQI
jgi:hypothetical protein